MAYITTFFILFYVISAIGVVWYFLPEHLKNNRKEVKIELYDNGDYSETPSIAILGRTENTVVRGYVRYHQGLYFTESEYEQYRDEVLEEDLA